ncbi:MAG: hypothetical protein ACFB16_08035 [Phormidesmis sp.]
MPTKTAVPTAVRGNAHQEIGIMAILRLRGCSNAQTAPMSHLAAALQVSWKCVYQQGGKA